MDSFSTAGDLLRHLLPRAPAPSADVGGVASPWPALDRATDGWRRGELVLVEGAAGTGKSALAYALALHAARRGETVALVPLKHSVETALQRLVCAAGSVPLDRVRRGRSDSGERAALRAAADELARLPIHLHTAPDPTLERLLDELRRLAAARGAGWLVVDGLASVRVGALDGTEPSTPVRATVAATALATLLARLGAVGVATAGAGVRVGGDGGRRLRIRTDRDGVVDAVEVVSERGETTVVPAALDRRHLRWRIG